MKLIKCKAQTFVSLLNVLINEEDAVRALILAGAANVRRQTARLTAVPAGVELMRHSSLQTGNR